MPRTFLTAEWRHLVMLNYAIDPAVLAPRVPPGVTLDTFGGVCYISVVGFRFLRTRVLGVPVPWHVNFDEVNLRFYVRRDLPGESRRGVCFVQEAVPRWAIAAVARWRYNEAYVACPMRSTVDVAAGRYEYGWRVKGDNRVAATCHGEPQPLVPGSEAEFIAEHYYGYVEQRDGRTCEYRVEHPPWRVWPADTAELRCDAAAVYGPEFAAALSGPPRSAFVAEGSAIAVRVGQPITSPQGTSRF